MNATETDDSVEQNTGDELEDLTFVFDDSVSQRLLKNFIQRHGSAPESEVSPDTDYLVIGDDPEQTELDNACAYDVPVLDECEFEEFSSDLVETTQCDWCKEKTEEIELKLSHFDDRPVKVDLSRPPEDWETNLCEACTERLAMKMGRLQRILGLHPNGDETDRAEKMVRTIDLIQSEPPNHDWEDTFPSDS